MIFHQDHFSALLELSSRMKRIGRLELSERLLEKAVDMAAPGLIHFVNNQRADEARANVRPRTTAYEDLRPPVSGGITAPILPRVNSTAIISYPSAGRAKVTVTMSGKGKVSPHLSLLDDIDTEAIDVEIRRVQQ